MTVNELILIESTKVRRDSNLMAFYIECFKEVFKYTPSCAGCSFSSDWLKFKRAVSKTENLTIQSKKIMGSFKLKKVTNKILSYKSEGRTFRSYDNTMTIEFVKGFLTNGTPEQIKERKELFSLLPVELQSKPKAVKAVAPIADPAAEVVSETTEDVIIIEVNVDVETVTEVNEEPVNVVETTATPKPKAKGKKKSTRKK